MKKPKVGIFDFACCEGCQGEPIVLPQRTPEIDLGVVGLYLHSSAPAEAALPALQFNVYMGGRQLEVRRNPLNDPGEVLPVRLAGGEKSETPHG